MSRRTVALWTGIGVVCLLALIALVYSNAAVAPAVNGKTVALRESAPASVPADNRSRRSHAVPGEDGRIYLGSDDLEQAVEQRLVPEGTRSILQTEGAMRHGQFIWQDDGKTGGDLLVWVDLDRQLVSAYRGGHEIGTSVILYGAEGRDSPLGSFPIKDKRERYYSRAYDAPMPYSLWLTDDGVAVHGSDVRWGRATHGCVGVPVEFARRLFEAAEQGDVVRILRSGQQVQNEEAQPS